MIATEKKYAFYPPETNAASSPVPRQARERQPGSTLVVRCTAGLIVLVSVALVLLAGFTAGVEKSYELERLNQELADLQNENNRLLFAIGRLESLERVETVAVDKLGMIKAEQVRMLAFGGGEAQDLAQGQDAGRPAAGDPAGAASGGGLAAALTALADKLIGTETVEAGSRP